MPLLFWETIVWTKANLFCGKKETKFGGNEMKRIKSSFKFGGGALIQGCFFHSTELIQIDKIMNANKHIDILNENLEEAIKNGS